MTDQSNHASVSVSVGQHVRIVLASALWTIDLSSGAPQLQPIGQQQVSPSTSCPPGVGCGSATATFDAVATGTSTLRASRTSCGEALACTPAAAKYAVHVRVH